MNPQEIGTLVTRLKPDDRISIGGFVDIVVAETSGSEVKLAIRAPKSVVITRYPATDQTQAQAETERPKAFQTSWRPGQTLKDVKYAVIIDALRHHDGNKTYTAAALGISIRGLRNICKEMRDRDSRNPIIQ